MPTCQSAALRRWAELAGSGTGTGGGSTHDGLVTKEVITAVASRQMHPSATGGLPGAATVATDRTELRRYVIDRTAPRLRPAV
eukprot:COSAG01_NODE_7304_length_3260_cov_7.615628_1_plen_83_part_00